MTTLVPHLQSHGPLNRHASPEEAIATQAPSVTEAAQTHGSGACPCGGGCPRCMQRKLMVGRTDDPLEREADRVAEQITATPASPQISRKCAECEEEETMHRKPLDSIPFAGNGAQYPRVGGLALSGEEAKEEGGLGQAGGAGAGVPVPAGCGGDHAMTFCNFNTGVPFTNKCDDLGREPCADAHEGQHRYDITSCCKRAAACIPVHGAASCQATWNTWIATNADWLECRAGHSGLACAQRQFKDLDCNSHPATPKCQNLTDLIALQGQVIAAQCPGAGNRFGPAPAACPF